VAVSAKLCEQFSSDALDRLSGSTRNGAQNLSVTLDASGNIVSRSDVGSYTYPVPSAPHPHAATVAGANTFTFDANGNVGTKNGLSYTWASFNLPTALSAVSGGTTLSSTFAYSPDHERYLQTSSYLNGTETTHYAGDLVEKVSTSTTTVVAWRHYVKTPSGRRIIIGRYSDGSYSKTYALSDHIGSSDLLVNGITGAVVVQESFAPYGSRRQVDWTAGVPGAGSQTAIAATTRRGFTFHEHLDNVGLIHMNGRVYDPGVGRFISVDPDGGQDQDTQSLNSYSYVQNRPLALTDPTGLTSCGKDGCAWNGPPFFHVIHLDSVRTYQPDSSAGDAGGQKSGATAADGQNSSAAGSIVDTLSGRAPGADANFGGSFEVVSIGQRLCLNCHNWPRPSPPAMPTTPRPGPANVPKPAEPGSQSAGSTPVPAVASPPPDDDDDDERGNNRSGDNDAKRNEGAKLVSNPKHHANSASPEPRNVAELFENSIEDRSGVRWAKDTDGTIHRFSKPSNGETHWNGSTAGDRPIEMRNVPRHIRRLLEVRE
jgi:RHS repeat-associated protein